MTHKLQKQALINTIGNVTYLVAQWILTVLTTRILGYESVGILTLSMSVGNVFTFIQLYGVRSFQSSDTSRQYTPGDYLLARIATTALGIMLCISYAFCIGYNKSISISIILFMLFRTFEAISDVFFGDFQREGRLELVGLTMFLRGVLTVLLFTAGLQLFHDLNKALFCIVMGSLALTAFLDCILYKFIVPWSEGSKCGVAGILRECFPLLLAALLPTVITAFPRVVLERYSGAELLGYYGNISTPAVIIIALVPNILTSIMPVYGEMVTVNDFTRIRKLWMKTIVGTVFIFVVCLLGVKLLGKPVLAWIYTDAIIPYVHFLYFFLISTTLYAITMCNAAVLTALRKNTSVSICAIVATAICVSVSFPLVRHFGISGAISALIISYCAQIIMQIIVVNRNTIQIGEESKR